MTATHVEHASMTDDGCPHDAPEYTPGAVRFVEYPHRDRMRYRAAVENAGGEVDGYNGAALTVLVPIHRAAFFAALARAGLALPPGRNEWNPHYFPRGSCAYPPHLLHDGRYPGSAGFLMYADLWPTEAPSAPSDY